MRRRMLIIRLDGTGDECRERRAEEAATVVVAEGSADRDETAAIDDRIASTPPIAIACRAIAGRAARAARAATRLPRTARNCMADETLVWKSVCVWIRKGVCEADANERRTMRVESAESGEPQLSSCRCSPQPCSRGLAVLLDSILIRRTLEQPAHSNATIAWTARRNRNRCSSTNRRTYSGAQRGALARSGLTLGAASVVRGRAAEGLQAEVCVARCVLFALLLPRVRCASVSSLVVAALPLPGLASPAPSPEQEHRRAALDRIDSAPTRLVLRHSSADHHRTRSYELAALTAKSEPIASHPQQRARRIVFRTSETRGA